MEGTAAVPAPGADDFPSTKMRYLKPVPRSTELEPQSRAVTVVSRSSRDVVYLDEPASIEIITEALKAWGLRVRAERTEGTALVADSPAPAVVAETPAAASGEATWQTTRSDVKAPTRLENALSPLWFPLRETGETGDVPGPWGWFTRAA